MIKEEDFAAAAEGPPDMAFVRLERKFREILEKNLEDTQSNGAYDHYVIEYMNHVLATAEALGLDFLEFFSVPDKNSNDVSDQYRYFRQTVDSYTVRIQIRHLREGSAHTVALSEQEKKHLRAYAEAIKDLIDKSEVVPAKKDRLYDRINAFIKEIDSERMPLQKFHDVVYSLATTGAVAADKLESAWKWVRLAAEVLGARQEADQKKLPPPAKKIEKPREQLPPPSRRNGSRRNMDDEIPF